MTQTNTKNSHGKRSKSKVVSMPINLYSDLSKIGAGDWKKGGYIALEAHKILHEKPELKLMNDVDILMSDLKTFYGENHYSHFSNFPAFFKLFLKKGFTNPDILKTRPEQNIEKFDDKQEEDVKDAD